MEENSKERQRRFHEKSPVRSNGVSKEKSGEGDGVKDEEEGKRRRKRQRTPVEKEGEDNRTDRFKNERIQQPVEQSRQQRSDVPPSTNQGEGSNTGTEGSGVQD